MKVKCKFCKEELDTSTSGFNDSANKCEYCNEYFCNSHIHWENHKCSGKKDEIKRIEEHEEHLKKLGRPLGIKLILLYNVLLLVFIIYTMLSGYGGFFGLLYVVALYYGLWKMKKDWMYLLLFGMIVSNIYYIYLILFISISNIIFVVLNTVSIYWLYSNRNLFIGPEKKVK